MQPLPLSFTSKIIDFVLFISMIDHYYTITTIPKFAQMNDHEKFVFLLTTQSVAKIVAQFIVDAFDERVAQL